MDLRRDRDLGALPTVVITASKPPWKGGDTYWREAQRRLAGLSSQTRQIVAADSGHAVPLEQPELVVAAIRELVDQVRSPTPCMHEDPL
jgi:pimeloyl-ACP methyl ester carboxylesterase